MLVSPRDAARRCLGTTASTQKYLRDKYAIIGVGETAYTRGSGRTTRWMATQAVRSAMRDAGIKNGEVDAMLSYQANDSVASPVVAGDLGIRLNFYMDVMGGGSSSEALIGIAIGIIEAGMAKTAVIFRSMNGFSGVRMGATGRAAHLVHHVGCRNGAQPCAAGRARELAGRALDGARRLSGAIPQHSSTGSVIG